MRYVLPVCVLLLLFTVLIFAGCSSPAGQGTVPATGSPGKTEQVSTKAEGKATTVSSEKVVISDVLNLMSGYPTTYKEYAFRDYGYEYLLPDDTFRVSIDSTKPVNILVIDKADQLKFSSVRPEWNTILKQNQWDYSPVVPVFSRSDVLSNEMTFRIEDKAAYFLIIDPRFSSEKIWEGSRHEDVRVNVKVTKI